MRSPGPSGRERLRNIALAVVSTGLMLGVAELALWLLSLPRAPLPRLGDELGAAMKALAANDQMPPWMERDPRLLWKYRPNQRVEEHKGVRWSYRTNALGLRGPEVPDRLGGPLILCAGDSVTAGYGVADADSYPAALQAALSRAPSCEQASVVNTGVDGYSSEQGRLALERNLVLFRANVAVVILEFGLNDARPAVVPDAALVKRSASVGTMTRWLARLRVYRVLRDVIVSRAIDRRVAEGRVGPRVPVDRYASNLRQMASMARAQGAVVVMVAPPSRREHQQRTPTSPLHAPVEVYRNAMASVACEGRIPYVEVPLLCGRSPESLGHFVDWCHPDAYGLCVLAQELAPIVVRACGGSAAMQEPARGDTKQ